MFPQSTIRLMRHLVGSWSPHNKRVKKHVFAKSRWWAGPGMVVLQFWLTIFHFFLHLRSTSGTRELRDNCTADSGRWLQPAAWRSWVLMPEVWDAAVCASCEILVSQGCTWPLEFLHRRQHLQFSQLALWVDRNRLRSWQWAAQADVVGSLHGLYHQVRKRSEFTSSMPSSRGQGRPSEQEKCFSV